MYVTARLARMNAHIDRLIEDVLCLPTEERSAVAAAIVDRLPSDETAAIPEAWRTELLQRRDDLRVGRDSGNFRKKNNKPLSLQGKFNIFSHRRFIAVQVQ